MARASLFAIRLAPALLVVVACFVFASSLATHKDASGAADVADSQEGGSKQRLMRYDHPTSLTEGATTQKEGNAQGLPYDRALSFGADGTSGTEKPARKKKMRREPKRVPSELQKGSGLNAGEDDDQEAGLAFVTSAFARRAHEFWEHIKDMPRHHFIVLLGICSVALMIAAALLRVWSVKVITEIDSPIESSVESLLPAQNSLGGGVEYNARFEDCPHEGGVHMYQARGQTLRICKHCGGRWILLKSTNTFVPVSRKAVFSPSPGTIDLS